MKAVTKERWLEAQTAERTFHAQDYCAGFEHYNQVYRYTFSYLSMDTNQHGKEIIEIGPADFPALAYCTNYKGAIIEPLPSSLLESFCKENRVLLIKQPVENIELHECDEVWIFNVLQHVIDPELLVEKCKSAAKKIRYFEPVDYPTSIHHPHTFSQEDFANLFGEARRYTERLDKYFDADCCYGTWKK